MSNYFSYKGYSGSYGASLDDDCMHGRILFIEEPIVYEAPSFSMLEASFRKAVDEYLQNCEKMGKPADKSYSGSFNLVVGMDLHRQAAKLAKLNNLSLNELMKGLLEKEIKLSGIM
jgi:predicted HicB family RNase H-like nuclease